MQKSIVTTVIDEFASRLRPYIPLTSMNIVWRKLDRHAHSILDVGCGRGETISFINRHRNFLAVGIDIFEPSLEAAKRQNVYRDLLLGDVRYLPFSHKSFDILICSEVIEHLEKKSGERLLAELERVARKQILLTTPVGTYKQHASGGNPHWEHKYIWNPEDFKSRGYKLRGAGLRGMGGEQGFFPGSHPVQKVFLYTIYCLGTIASYYFPKIACHIVAEKYFEKREL